MNLIVPEQPGPWPVLYLLHGLSDDHTIWHRRTSIERYVEGTGLLVVMPTTDRAFYVNDPRTGGLRYEDHICQDVLGFVERTFPVIADRTGRAVAGLSMGGYGAIMLALRNPELFSAACAHSSALYFGHMAAKHHLGDDVGELNDAVLRSGQYDCFKLAERLAKNGPDVALRVDCGTDDRLLQQNRDFHAHLESLGLAHEYAEYPGGHNWAYWDEHIRDSLALLGRHLPALAKSD